MMTLVSIVIVNYNTRDRTLECLDSLMDLPMAGREVIVVDNGSADGSVKAFRERHPSVTVIEAGDNIGFARGVNLGVASAGGTYILLLNPDTTVLAGSVEALVQFAEAHPEFGVYGGRTLTPQGDLDPRSCWGAPSVWSLVCFASGLSKIFKRTAWFDPESLGNWQRDTVREVPIITGCLLLMRRDAWNAMGGMDELYFLYGEDAEFSLRAAQLGHRPVLVPDAVIVHDVGVSTGSSGAKMCMVMAGKATMLRQRWTPWRRSVGLLLLLAGVRVRALLEGGNVSGTWSTVWRRRNDWAPGYPSAELALFGRPHRTS